MHVLIILLFTLTIVLSTSFDVAGSPCWKGTCPDGFWCRNRSCFVIPQSSTLKRDCLSIMCVAYQQSRGRVHRPPLVMIFLLTLVYSSTFATNCSRPGYNFYSATDFPGLQEDQKHGSSFLPGTLFEGRCYDGSSVDIKTCYSNGSWSIGPTNCSIDVVFGKPVKDLLSNSFVNKTDVFVPADGKYYRITRLTFTLAASNDSQDIQISLVSRQNEMQTSKQCLLFGNMSSVKCELDKTTHIQLNTKKAILHLSAFTTDTRPFEQFGQRTTDIGTLLGETFLFSKNEACFDTAREDCQSVGGRLLDSWTEEELELLRTHNSHQQIWLGLKVKKTGWIEKKWMWLNETELDKESAKWEDVDEAAPMRGHAAVMDMRTVLWRSVPRCSIMYHFVCRLDAPKTCLPSMAGSPERGRLIGYCEDCQQVTYKCDDGFFMKGDPHRDCDIDGKWAARMPECLTAEEIAVNKCSCDSIPGPGEEVHCAGNVGKTAVDNCHCPADKLRHPNGMCVDLFECPSDMLRGNCTDDQIFSPWSVLEPSCSTTEIPWTKESVRIDNARRCICKKNLLRDHLSRKCVKADDCTNN